MNTRRVTAACAAITLLGASASAHRLDEYLQATLLSIEKDRVQGLMRLTPGVAVSAFVLTSVDANADGEISEAERRAYAERVLRDVSLKIDEHKLSPQLISVEFPGVEEMKQGLGEIQIEFGADLPRSGRDRRLVFENRHQSRISAYLVNCLAPSDPDIRIVAQNRNEQQSFYQVDYAQGGAASGALRLRWWQDVPAWPSAAVLLTLVRLAFLWRRRAVARQTETSAPA
jgi:hypothetical protein